MHSRRSRVRGETGLELLGSVLVDESRLVTFEGLEIQLVKKEGLSVRAAGPLRTIPTDAMSLGPNEEGRRLLEWSLAGLQPGLHTIDLQPYRHRLWLDVSDQSRRLDVRLPEIAEVVVRAVSGRDGSPAPIKSLRWTIVDDYDRGIIDGSGQPWGLTEMGTDGAFHFAAAVGSKVVLVPPADEAARSMLAEAGLTIMGGSDGHVIHPGLNELSFEIRPRCGVRVELRVDGERIPTDYVGNQIRIESVERDHGGRFVGDCLEVGVSGRYRVVLPHLSADHARRRGFVPVEPLELDVPRGEIVTAVIELERLSDQDGRPEEDPR